MRIPEKPKRKKRKRSLSKLPFSIVIILAIVLSFLFFKYHNHLTMFNSREIPARFIILMIGDGMHLNHEIAASRYWTGEDKELSFHKMVAEYKGSSAFVTTWDVSTYNALAEEAGKAIFDQKNFEPLVGYNPQMGSIQPDTGNYAADQPYFTKIRGKFFSKQGIYPATDSAAAATSMATGRKTLAGRIAWSENDSASGRLRTIAERLRSENKFAIGIVSTVPFTHATPAAFVSHNRTRKHYASTSKGKNLNGMSIGEEILYQFQPDLVISGGHPAYESRGFHYIGKKEYDYLRNDSNYILAEKSQNKSGDEILQSSLKKAMREKRKLFGLFGGKEGCFAGLSPEPSGKEPRLQRRDIHDPDMAQTMTAALTYLRDRAGKRGFFLVAEQGDIDWANHNRDYRGMVGSVLDLHQAVTKTIDFINEPGDELTWENTLLIVTSDHANSFLRFQKKEKLVRGYLPVQLPPQQGKYGLTFANESYPGGELKYGLGEHTNELVSFYAIGKGSELASRYKGLWYPGTNILDNTQIYQMLARSGGLAE